MNIPPAVALPIITVLACLAMMKAVAALREKQIAWGSHGSLVINRDNYPGAFWFSVGLLGSLSLGLFVVSMHLALTLLAGA